MALSAIANQQQGSSYFEQVGGGMPVQMQSQMHHQMHHQMLHHQMQMHGIGGQPQMSGHAPFQMQQQGGQQPSIPQ